MKVIATTILIVLIEYAKYANYNLTIFKPLKLDTHSDTGRGVPVPCSHVVPVSTDETFVVSRRRARNNIFIG